VYTWFKNNKPFKDRSVFKLERKISLRRVVGKLKADHLHNMVIEKTPGIKKGEKGYPGEFQKCLTVYMSRMDDEEIEGMEKTREEWQASGPPMDVRIK
jgi:hypothetical protein